MVGPSEVILAWNALEGVFREHFYEPDMEAAKLLYASVAAHRLVGQPVWPMLIAPPGSMKTELLKTLSKQPNTLTVDSITPRTFLSGQFGNKAGDHPSLLHKIGPSGIILIPDFSTISSKRPEDRGAIYADLRRIFDGELTKRFGTRDDADITWSGRITACVAATPQIDAYLSFEGALGDRFVRIRMSRSGVKAALFAMRQDPKKVRTATTQAVSRLFELLPRDEPEVHDDFAEWIAELADCTAIGRSHVEREQGTKEISGGGVDHAESAARLSQQFSQLARGLALLGGRHWVGHEDLVSIRRVAFDTLPPRRAELIRRLLRDEYIAKSTSTLKYDLEDLEYLKLVVLQSEVPFLAESTRAILERHVLCTTVGSADNHLMEE